MNPTELKPDLIVVFDTNALLPLLVGATRRAQALRQLWKGRGFELCITPQVLAEVERVLTYPTVQRNFGVTSDDVQQVVAVLGDHARVLPGLVEGVTAVETDPSDNVFLAAALEAGVMPSSVSQPHQRWRATVKRRQSPICRRGRDLQARLEHRQL